jgi:PKD repeat protein
LITNRSWNFGNGVTTNITATNVSAVYPVAGTYTVALTVSSSAGTNTLTRVAYITGTNALVQIATNGYTLLSESCPNGALDPAEMVSLSLGLRNGGSAPTTNLVATLQATGGVLSPSGPQAYGALAAGGGAASRTFSFVLSGTCGGTNVATVQLQDGPANLGTVAFALPLGSPAPIFSQNFDGVSAPALPAGWTTATSGSQSLWVSSTGSADSSPNAAFSPDPAAVGVNELVTPAFVLPMSTAQLKFRHSFNLEASGSTSTGYDGGVLEIKIGASAFTDILAAGGSFSAGGYTRTLSSGFSNPLAGRQAWSGNSGGFTNTIVILPASAAGQSIQLKWRCGSDSSVGVVGWYVDTITVSALTCCSSIVLIPEAPPVLSTAPFTLTVLGSAGQVYSIEASTNFSSWTQRGVVTNVTGQAPFTDPNPANLLFRAYRARLLP